MKRATASLLVFACWTALSPSEASARRPRHAKTARRVRVQAGAATARHPIALTRWLGPTARASVAAALASPASGDSAAAGRDGGLVRWRPVPPALAREAAQRPMRLQALVERAGSGAVLAAGRLCVSAATTVQLEVDTTAAARVTLDGSAVIQLRPWPDAQRWRRRHPGGAPARHTAEREVKAGCHDVRVAVEADSGALGVRLWWRPWRPLRPAVAMRQPLPELAAEVQRGGHRGADHEAVWARLKAARDRDPTAARLVALRLAESGDRIAALSEASARWPSDLALGLALVEALDDAGRAHDALRLWRQRLAGAERRDPRACAARATLWQRLDVSPAARAMARRCRQRFPRDLSVARLCARLAAAADDSAAAAAASRDAARLAAPDPEAWLDALGAAADLAEGTVLPGGVARLRGALSRAPAGAQAWDRARARAILALAWLHRGAPRRAVRLLRAIPPWARRASTLALLARAELRAANAETDAEMSAPPSADPTRRAAAVAAARTTAVALLREAIRRAPRRADLRARLALLVAARPFYQPYALPLLAQARAAAGRPISATPFTQLLRQTVVRQLGPGRLARYEVAMWRIGRGGPTSHDVEVSVVPSQATAEVLQAAIAHPNGHVERGVPQRLERVSEAGTGLYYEEEQITLSYRKLKPGDVLWVAYTLRDFAPDPFGLVFSELFQLGDAWPVLKTDIVLELDAKLRPQSAWRQAGKRATVHRDVLRDDGVIDSVIDARRRWRFTLGPIAAVPVEPRMPGAAEAVDTLHVSTFASWSAAARWYAKLVAEALPTRGALPEVRQLAHKLVAEAARRGQTSPAAKVAAIYRWVADEVRYVGLEFGMHSLKPHAVAEVMARRFGDCKDKATLLVTLLAEVGIHAQVALVRTADAGKLRDGVASLGGFGHAIAYVPCLNWWLDATVQHHQPTELPDGDVGGQALVIPAVHREPAGTQTAGQPSAGQPSAGQPSAGRPNAGGARGLVDLPDAGPDNNRREAHGFVQLHADGGAAISLTIRAHGLPAASLREQLHAPVSRKERVQRALSPRFPGLSVRSVRVSGVNPPADEVVVQVEASAPNLAKRQGRGWLWHPLLPPTPWRKRAPPGEARVHPEVAPYSWRDVRSVVVAPPKGWRLRARPQRDGALGGLGSYMVRVKALSGGRWRFSRTVTRARRVLPAARYAALRGWLAGLDVALGQPVGLTPATEQP